jgi:outer membrane protein assembly factor BamE
MAFQVFFSVPAALRMRAFRQAMCGLAVLTVTGCSTGLSGLSPYQIDIQQGNVVTREQAEVLKPGMARAQVRDVLGSPLLTSLFHANRWDYVFTFQRQGQPLQERKLTVFFQDDKVERVEADALPSEAEFVASLQVRRPVDKAPVLQATDEQLKAFQARNAAPAMPPATPPAGTAPVAYPPLESTGADR